MFWRRKGRKSEELTAGDPDEVDHQKQMALEIILDAWDEGLTRASSEILASTAIFAALTDMVDLHGEEIVAEMVSNLSRRVRAGEFTLQDDEE